MAKPREKATTKAVTKARKAKAKSASTSMKAKRPDGSISSGIYDAVEKLVAGGNLTRAAAFRQLAKQTGRNANTVAVNYYYVAKKRGAKPRLAAKRAAKGATTAPAKAPKAGARKAKPGASSKGVSAMIYDAIEKLVAGDRMTRAAAFRQLAKQTGRKEGTVAVNYYYAAKKRGAKLRKRGRPKAVAATRNGASSRIESVLKSLSDLLRAQEAELTALRQEGERFAEIRRLVGS